MFWCTFCDYLSKNNDPFQFCDWFYSVFGIKSSIIIIDTHTNNYDRFVIRRRSGRRQEGPAPSTGWRPEGSSRIRSYSDEFKFTLKQAKAFFKSVGVPNKIVNKVKGTNVLLAIIILIINSKYTWLTLSETFKQWLDNGWFSLRWIMKHLSEWISDNLHIIMMNYWYT